MKKILKLIFTISYISLVISCQKPIPVYEIIIDDADFETDILTDDFTNEYNSLNSLDYMGMYSGVMPCVDCEGIETMLELSSGNSYVKKIIYLGKSDQQAVKTSGTFTWNEEGNTISLDGEPAPNQYFVSENVLLYLDIDGNIISGEQAENYELRKE